jgi:hypothetical protein
MCVSVSQIQRNFKEFVVEQRSFMADESQCPLSGNAPPSPENVNAL